MPARQPPRYLDLFRIRLPIPGFVSILHRVSGAFMFLFCWALLWLLQMTLQSAESFEQVQALAEHWLARVFGIAMLWAFLHHFFAGLRFLLLDVHVAVDLGPARATSWAVLAASLGLTAAIGAWLW
jgi:succinate dehydrogenase / fumarate reductase cytochrome b subunit